MLKINETVQIKLKKIGVIQSIEKAKKRVHYEIMTTSSVHG